MDLQAQNMAQVGGSAAPADDTSQLSQTEVDAIMQGLRGQGGSRSRRQSRRPLPMRQLPQQGQFFDMADMSDAEVDHLMQLYGQQPVSPSFASQNANGNPEYEQLVPREGYAIPYRRPVPPPPEPTGLARWVKRYRVLRQRAEAYSMSWWALKLLFGAMVGLPVAAFGGGILLLNGLFLNSSVVVALIGSIFLLAGLGYLIYFALAPLLQKWIVNVPDKHYYVVVQHGANPVEYLPSGLWQVPFRFNAKISDYVDFQYIHIKDTFLNLFQGAGPQYDLDIGVMLAFNPVYADPRNYRKLLSMKKPIHFRQDVLRVIYDALWQYLGPFSLLDWTEALEQRPDLTSYLTEALRDLEGLGLTPGNTQPVTVFVRGLDDVENPARKAASQRPAPESPSPPVQDIDLTQPSTAFPQSRHEGELLRVVPPPMPSLNDEERHPESPRIEADPPLDPFMDAPAARGRAQPDNHRREKPHPTEPARTTPSPREPARAEPPPYARVQQDNHDHAQRRDLDRADQPDGNQATVPAAGNNHVAPPGDPQRLFVGDDLDAYFPQGTLNGPIDEPDITEADTIVDEIQPQGNLAQNGDRDDEHDDSDDSDLVRRHLPPRRDLKHDEEAKRKGGGARDSRPEMPWVRGRPEE